MNTRIIGIDLAVTASHKAIVLEQASNTFLSNVLEFHTDPADLDFVLETARAGTSEPVHLKAVLEATAMTWYVVGQYLHRHGVEVYRVNGQQVADLRRVYKRHAKSDRIDSRVLARLPLLAGRSLHRCFFPSGPQMALQRGCREVARLKELVVASKTRILATDQLTWLGFSGIVPPFSNAAYWLRENWYDPWRVRDVGPEGLAEAWQTASLEEPVDSSWIPALLERAEQVIRLYDSPSLLDYGQFQASLQREQERLRKADEQAHHLRLKMVRPLYRQLHPHRHLETIRGIGQDSAAIYLAFIGDIQRFPSLGDFLGWSGLIPFSRQSGDANTKGLRVTKAGPNLIKATAFLNAGVARQWDPQIAAVYHRQMMTHGKHHLQATCACATHLLTRVYAVLRDERPYELRDASGSPVDKPTARRICLERYHVPAEVRGRNNRRARQERQEARVEKRYESRRAR